MEQSKRDRIRNLLQVKGIASNSGLQLQRQGKLSGPASFGQRALWFAHQESRSGAYNILSGFRLLGPFCSARLGRALQTVLARHEVLRTQFSIGVDGELEQHVLAEIPLPLHVRDLQDLSLEEQRRQIGQEIQAQALHVFDLGQAPLMRVSLFQCAQEEHVLLANVHHIVNDGWSQHILLSELAGAYNSDNSDGADAAARPPLPVQFLDYAIWEKDFLSSAAGQSQVGYWQELMRDAPQHALPLNTSRAQARAAAGARYARHLSPSAMSALQQFAQAQHVSHFNILMAVYVALLMRYSGEEDIVFGFANAQRQKPQVQGLIGYFVNGLPARIRAGAEVSFLELIHLCRDSIHHTLANQDVPLEMIMDALQCKRDPDLHPLFQLFLSYHRNEQQTVSFGDAKMAALDQAWEAARAAKFELALAIQEQGGALELVWEWNSRLFDLSFVRNLDAVFEYLLQAACRQPQLSLARLALPVALCSSSAGTVQSNPLADGLLSFYQMFAHQAQQRPQAVAIGWQGREWTYAQLEQMSAALARRLQAQGVQAGSVLALPLARSVLAVTAVLAASRLGAVFVPIDPHAPALRIADIVQRSGALLLLLEAGAALDVPGLDICPQARLILAADGSLEADAREAAQPLPPVQQVQPDQVAYIVFTSGSTGVPKGVCLSHANLRAFLIGMAQQVPFAAHMRYSQVINLATDMGLQNIFCALAFGGEVDILSDAASKDPALYALHVQQRPTDFAVFTPSHFLALYQPQVYATPMPRRALLLEGEALSTSALQLLPVEGGCQIVNAYGPTETNVCALFVAGTAPLSERVPIGLPLAADSLRVVNQHGLDQPQGALGELWIEGATVAHGYVGGISGNFELGSALRRYRSGDVVRMRSDGQYEYFARRDSQIKIRGFRVELGEIESCLRAHAGVADVAVRFFAHAGGDGQLCAYLVPHQGQDQEQLPSAVKAWVSAHLPPQMWPQHYLLLPQIARMANGKINVRALPEPDWQLAQDSGSTRVAPQGALEMALAQIWGKVLNVSDIGRDDNFFALGGNSIKAIRIVAQGKAAGLIFSSSMLYEYPAIAALAPHVTQQAFAAPEEVRQEHAFALLPPAARASFGPEVEDAYPLSALQQAMVANYLVSAGRLKYLIVRRQDLNGPLCLSSLRQALAILIARYPLLRTAIDAYGEHGGLQRVLREVEVPLLVHDLQQMDADGQQLALDECVTRRRTEGLPLTQAPLFYLDLFVLGKERQVLVWTIHHAILDGWSIARLVEQVMQLHATLLAKGEPRLAAPTTSFRRLVELEQVALADSARLENWRTYLADTHFAGLPRLAYAGQDKDLAVPICHFPIPAATIYGLQNLMQSLQVPLKTLFFAAYARVMGLLCGQDALLSGYCSHGREEVEGAEWVPGLFVCTLPVVVRHAQASWAEVVAQAAQAEKWIWAERHLPLASIVHAVQAKQGLFEHYFNFVDFHSVASQGRAQPVQDAQQLQQPGFLYNLNEFVLTTNIVLGASAHDSQLYLSFDPEQLSLAQVQAYGALMLQAFADLAAHVEQAPLVMSSQVRWQAQQAWNQTAYAFDSEPYQGLIHGGFLRQACLTPEAAALLNSQGQISYRQLLQMSLQLSKELQAAGVQPGERVALRLARGPQQVVAVLAILLAGAAYVPLDPDWPVSRCDAVLSQAGARLCMDSSGEPLAAPVFAFDWEQFQARCEDLQEDPAQVWPPQLPSATAHSSDLAYIIFTSGSTGRPKGVAMQHGAVVNTLQAVNRELGIGPADRVLAVAALTFDLSVYDIFGTLACGAALVLPDAARGLDPAHWLDLCVQMQVTIWNSVPMAAALLLEQVQQMEQRTPGLGAALALRRFMLSGDKIATYLPGALQDCLPQARVLSMGGATEAAIWSIWYRLERDCSAWRSVPYGQAMPNQAFYILDAQQMPQLPGVEGELYIAGEGLALAYFGDQERTQAAFFLHPQYGLRLYKTGDLGRFLPDGNIEFIGRNDFQVKVRGYRIELGDIEACLARHPQVKQALLRVYDDAQLGRMLIAGILAQDSTRAPDWAELRQFAQQHLPPYMLPHAFVLVTAMPLSANGKLDRNALPLPQWENEAQQEQDLAQPRTAQEARLLQVWQQVLGNRQFGIHDNFFELGGDSIMALRVLSESARAGLRLNLQDFYRAPSVAGMAAQLQHSTLAVGTDLQLQAGQSMPLLPAQAAWFAQSASEHRHHFNQAISLDMPQIDSERLHSMLQTVAARHLALRLQFVHTADGWQARLRAADAPRISFAAIALSAPDTEEQQHLRLQKAQQAQRAFVLDADAPLLQALHFHGAPGGDRLLLIAHHLVVDAVSWQVMLSDLEACRQNLQDRQPPSGLPTLPPEDTTLWQYAGFLQAQLQAGRFAKQLGHWLDQLRADGTQLPPQAHAPRGRMADAHTCRIEFDGWGELLAAAGREQLEARALLCSAFSLAYSRWSGYARSALMLEGHGRNAFVGADSAQAVEPGAVDVSACVGWLTAIFPLALEVDGDLEPQAQIQNLVQAAAQALAATPAQGLGYALLRHVQRQTALQQMAEPLLCLNYFGEFADSEQQARSFRLVSEASGDAQAQEAPMPYLLSVSGAGNRQHLRLLLEADGQCLAVDAIEAFAQALRQALQDVHQHFCAATTTPAAAAQDGAALSLCYPATPTQQALILHSMLESGAATYVNQLALDLQGVSDAKRLQRAWQALVQRHEVLRAAFINQGAESLMQVHSSVQIPWEVADVRAFSGPERELQLQQLRQAQRQHGFDADSAPLMRILWAQTSADEGQMIWTYHHALLDGWSLPIVLMELLKLYAGAQLPPAVSYAAYARWLAERDWQAAAAYWQTLLQDCPSCLRLDLPPATPGMHGVDTLHLHLSPDLHAGLQRQARQLRVTGNILIQSAWAILLQQYSALDDLVFGATHAGRPLEVSEADKIVGLFINTIPVRAQLLPAHSIAQLCAQLFAQQAEGSAHNSMPLAHIVQQSGALFDSVVVFENYHLPNFKQASSQAEIRVTGLQSDEGTHYGLTLIVMNTGGTQLKLSYRRDRYRQADVQRMLAQLEQILTCISADSSLRLDAIPTLLPLEVQQRDARLQVRSARTPAAWQGRSRQSPQRLEQQFANMAWQYADALALCCAGENWTYRQLAARANQITHALLQAGAQGKRVALAMQRCNDLVAAIIGILQAGASYVPVDPALPLQRQEFILDDADCALLLTQQHLGVRWSGLKLPLLAVEDCRGPEDEINLAAMNPEAYMIYTSGTTGKPKGVMVEHGHVLRLFASTDSQFVFGASDVWTLFHSYAFDFSVWEIWGALLYGGRLEIVPLELGRNAEAFLDFLLTRKVTVLNQTPSAFAALVAAEQSRAWQKTALRYVIFGGEALDVMSLQSWSARHGFEQPHLVNMYGITETTVHVTWHFLQEQDLRADNRCIGLPLPDLSIRLLDPWLRDVAPGVCGEIVVGGAGVSAGYHRRPQLNAERFVHIFGQRHYRSGDLGRLQADGKLDYLGRMDQQVKIRGFRIELGEIESALSAMPQVQQACVLCQPLATGPGLVAYLVAVAGDAAETGLSLEIKEHLAHILPEYMLPSAYVFLQAMPLTGNGKVDKKALPLPRFGEAEGSRAPQGEEEVAIAAIWEEVLHCKVQDVRANFHDLGGHSLKLGQVISRIQARFGAQIPFASLYAEPSVQAQAALLRASLRGVVEAIPALTVQEREQGVALTSAQARIWYLCQNGGQNQAYNIPLLLRLRGALQMDACLQALRALVQRHAALRTLFRAGEGVARQYVQEEYSFTPVCVEVDDENQARRHADQILQHAFDLSREIPIQAGVLKLGADHHWLVVNIHHIVCDAWSVAVLLEDFAALYSALCNRQPESGEVGGERGGEALASLPPLPLQLVDVAAWMNSPQQLAKEAAMRAYWARQLQGHDGILPLQTDYPRAAQAAHTGSALALAWPQDLSAQLHAAAAAHGMTQFMLLLAAYGLLLQRMSGSNDLIIGIAYGMRERLEFERMVGFFANSLPIRLRMQADMQVGEYLQQVKQVVGAAYENGSMPLERIIDVAGISRRSDRMPLFQAMFTLQNINPAAAIQLPGISLEKLAVARTSSKFDLSLSLAESAQGIRGEIEYDLSLFAEAGISRCDAQLQHLVRQLCADPAQTLGRLQTLPAAQAASAMPELESSAAGELEVDLDLLSLEEIEAKIAALAGESL